MCECCKAEDKIKNVIEHMLSMKETELLGMYNSSMERMIAEKRIEWTNEAIDECIDIIKREFEL